MRVSTDPTDPAYVDDRPRRVWCNDVEIIGWTVADEFRRCVITPERVHNGAVRIERLPRFVRHEQEDTPQLAAWLDMENGPVPVVWWGHHGVDPNATGGRTKASDTDAAQPIHTGFAGMLVHVPDAPAATPAPAPSPAPAAKKTTKRRRR